MYLRAVALASGHSPEGIDTMTIRDLELLAMGAFVKRHVRLQMGET